MFRVEPGTSDNNFNLVGLSAQMVERFLGALSEEERKLLGKEPASSHTLNAVAKILETERQTNQIVDNVNQPPQGTTAPPANG